jgi:hypothetical protein
MNDVWIVVHRVQALAIEMMKFESTEDNDDDTDDDSTVSQLEPPWQK